MASTAPTAIIDLPPEILHSVFDSLDGVDLHAVCLVCRALHGLAESALYAKIYWTWSETKIPPISLLLRSILSRPGLGAHIKSLQLDGNDFDRRFTRGGMPPTIPVNETVLLRLTAFIDKLNFPYGDLWVCRLRTGTMDAYVAALLAHLPNLTTLHVDTNFGTVSQIVGILLRLALCNSSVKVLLPTFQHLQKVSVEAIGLLRPLCRVAPGMNATTIRSLRYRNTEDMLPYLYLPSIQYLSASIANPVSFAWPTSQLPCSSALTSLHLKFFREAHIKHILPHTTALKTLHWE